MSEADLLPVALIVTPILAATLPIALGLRFERAGWPVAAVTTTGLFAAALALATVVYAGGEPITHELGGFPPQYGIQLVADGLSAPFTVLVTAAAAGVLVFTRVAGPRGNAFYTAYLLLVGGLLGISLTGDVFNLFVFLEISSLATYALVASGDGPESAVAALKYLILGTLGASIYLTGVALLFMATGTLNMNELAGMVPAELDGQQLALARAAFAFVFVGFALKVAQWPLHTWQPDAYQHAPDAVTPLIAALVSTASAYALGRVAYTVFGPEFLASTPYLTEVVVTVGSTSVLAGSALAAIQQDVKRMFAFSSVAQFGLIVAAYGVLTETAFAGAVFHLLGHGLLKGGLFLAVAAVALSTGARTVDEYAGLAARRPLLAGTMSVMLVALVGVPPSVGFVGKWYIAIGAVEAEAWPVAAVVFLSTMFTLAYAARLLEKMYFTPPTPVEAPHAPGAVATDGGRDRVTTGMCVVLVAVAVAAVVFGFAGGVFYDSLLGPFLETISIGGV
ncbi:proton-conducting transporter membrane subunit [Salinilacihabitans rarus]|uniref:proton-conducting transporter transmembrane domain-containing protein n=1 Tax=Salinilacihabitans rarus TaxID=2961596 RepID=UPI0020C8AFFD|nr:proton-conducting transporter membrane subunit [Salinilacihabitans rarus]